MRAIVLLASLALLTTLAPAPTASAAICLAGGGGGDCFFVQGGNACWRQVGSNGVVFTQCFGFDGYFHCTTSHGQTHCVDVL